MSVDRLAPRHKECLRLVYERRTTKEIAQTLGIAPGTVSSYCAEAVALLGAADRREAAEILHSVEAVGAGPTPFDNRGHFEGVEAEPLSTARPLPAARPAHLLGPLSPANRDADNDASLTVRLAWILGLAIGLAIAFGSIVTAARSLSDIVRGS